MFLRENSIVMFSPDPIDAFSNVSDNLIGYEVTEMLGPGVGRDIK